MRGVHSFSIAFDGDPVALITWLAEHAEGRAAAKRYLDGDSMDAIG